MPSRRRSAAPFLAKKACCSLSLPLLAQFAAGREIALKSCAEPNIVKAAATTTARSGALMGQQGPTASLCFGKRWGSLKLEVRGVGGVRLDPFLFGERSLGNNVMTHLRFDVLHVAPAIGSAIFEPVDLRCHIGRHVFGVRHLGDFTVLRVENLYSVVGIAGCSSVQRSLDTIVGFLLAGL